MNFTSPELLSLYDLLTNRLFQIPDYQRTYSWKKKQRTDLLNDITKVKSKNQEQHFMSTLVCLKKGKRKIGGSLFEVLDVVDGQQRITTLIILLKALHKNLANGNQDEKDIADDLGKLLVKEKDETIILLQTNHDTSNVFSEYLRNGLTPNKDKIIISAERNLLDAYSEMETFVKSWGGRFGLDSLYEIIMDKLKFILHIVEDEGIVYTVFEVLNSRGLDVDWLDKCKSLLMGIVYDATEDPTLNSTMKELHTTWSNIYRTIGLNAIKGDEIIRYAITLWTKSSLSKVLGSQEALDNIREYCGTSNSNVVEMSNWILKVSNELLKIEQNPFLDAITKISQVRLLKVAIELRDDLSDKEKSELRDVWEKTSFKIFGLAQKDSRSKVGDYVRLSQSIVKKKRVINNNEIVFPKNEIKNSIIKLAEGFRIDEIIDGLSNLDLYDANNWKEELRYFFYKYEKYLNAKKGYNFPDIVWTEIWGSKLNETIEHIYPQTPKDRWEEFPKDFQVHRLGNLTIVMPTINSEANNKDFKNKKTVYNKDNRLLGLIEIGNVDSWNVHSVEAREKKLLDWAKTEWSGIKAVPNKKLR